MTADARRRALTRAVLSVIDTLPATDLIGAVTPERIGQEVGYSASSVRYQFARLFGEASPGASGASTWTFDRTQLWDAILDDIEDRILTTTMHVRDGYLDALEQAARCGHAGPLRAAVLADLDAYAVGAKEAPASLSERAYLLAVTACDQSAEVAGRLRMIRRQELSLYFPLYERGLQLTGRRLLPGHALADVAGAVAHLVEGAAMCRRHTVAGDRGDALTARAMLAVFAGLTEPAPGASAAPLRELRCEA